MLGMSKDNEEGGDVLEFKKREHNERYLFILCYILEKYKICFLSWYILTYFSLAVDNQYFKKINKADSDWLFKSTNIDKHGKDWDEIDKPLCIKKNCNSITCLLMSVS